MKNWVWDYMHVVGVDDVWRRVGLGPRLAHEVDFLFRKCVFHPLCQVRLYKSTSSSSQSLYSFGQFTLPFAFSEFIWRQVKLRVGSEVKDIGDEWYREAIRPSSLFYIMFSIVSIAIKSLPRCPVYKHDPKRQCQTQTSPPVFPSLPNATNASKSRK